MIKELKIAKLTMALAILAVFALDSSSLAAETNLKDLLSKPGVAEQLQATYGGKSTYDGQQDTPLVGQAKKFALRINPPPPPQPVQPKQAPGTSQPVRPKVSVSAQFKLIGTSYHFGDQTQSWALIDEVGKGIHWVKQGSKVGHLSIEKVGDGGVLIDDNGKKYELLADRQNRPDVVKSYTGILDKAESIVLMDGAKKVTGQAESVEPAPEPNAPATPAVQEPQTPPVPELTPEEKLQQTQNSIEWLKKMQQESAGMSPEEANQLGNLGNMLTTMENEAKQLQSQPSSGADSNTNANNNPQQQTPPSAVEENNNNEPNSAQKPSSVKTRTVPQRSSEQIKLRRTRERR